MAGPFFLGLFSIARSNRVEVARALVRSSANHNIGLILGESQVKCVLKSNSSFVDDILRELDNPLPFLVTSNPLDYDVMTVFENELAPWNKTESRNASLLAFLREIWSIDGVGEFIVAIWDFMVPDIAMRRLSLSFEKFLEWLRNYYHIEHAQDQSGGAQGIFLIHKTT